MAKARDGSDDRKEGVLAPLPVDFSDAGVCLMESHHGAGFRMPPTIHGFCKVLHVISGEGKLHWFRDGQPAGSVALAGGEFIFVAAGLEHRIEDRSARPLSLNIAAVETDLLGGYEPPGPLLVLRNARRALDLQRLLRSMLVEQGAAWGGRRMLLHGMAACLVGQVCREGRPPGEPEGAAGASVARQRVVAYAESLAHCFFDDEPLDAVAGRLGISRRSFTAHFRDLTGTSRDSLLRRLRIRHACGLLRATERSIVGIAFECGFNDLSSFYRAFRQEKGQAPLEFRQLARSGNGTDA